MPLDKTETLSQSTATPSLKKPCFWRKENFFEVHEHEEDMICLKDLGVNYRHHIALEGISGTFKKKTITAIVGPNGGGKSTLLKAIMGLLPISKGRVSLDRRIKGSIAYLPQLSQIDRNFPLTVQDLVAAGFCQSQGFFRRFDKTLKERVLFELENVGMQDLASRTLHSLSGGQFQRVLFARLSLQNASCILLDEPFTAMDAYTISDLVKILLKWRDQGKTLIVVNHDMDLVRDYFPQTIIIARKALGWGPTNQVLTLDNLRKAKQISRQLEADHVIHDSFEVDVGELDLAKESPKNSQNANDQNASKDAQEAQKEPARHTPKQSIKTSTRSHHKSSKTPNIKTNQ